MEVLKTYDSYALPSSLNNNTTLIGYGYIHTFGIIDYLFGFSIYSLCLSRVHCFELLVCLWLVKSFFLISNLFLELLIKRNNTYIYIMCPDDLCIGGAIVIGKLPDHLLIDIFIRVPSSEWIGICCVKKQWAQLFQHETFWRAALLRNFPMAAHATRTWPGPIFPHNFSKRRYAALYISKNLFCRNEELDEMLGHAYLFLKDQLELSTMPLPAGVLHGTLIDQFIACGKSRDKAHELASQIWVAVIDNLEENQQTFVLLKRLALEGDVYLSYPYSRSVEVEWRVFEKLFTDYRDCFNTDDYYDILACAKHKFQPIPSIWLGF